VSTADDPIRVKRYGRPPKPREAVRSERIVSFVTPSEFRQLEKISDHRGVSLSAVIHSMVIQPLDESLRTDLKDVSINQQRSEK